MTTDPLFDVEDELDNLSKFTGDSPARLAERFGIFREQVNSTSVETPVLTPKY